MVQLILQQLLIHKLLLIQQQTQYNHIGGFGEGNVYIDLTSEGNFNAANFPSYAIKFHESSCLFMYNQPNVEHMGALYPTQISLVRFHQVCCYVQPTEHSTIT